MVTSDIAVPIILIDKVMPQIVDSITQPLYEVFNFYRAPASMIEEELLKMIGGLTSKPT